MCPAAVPVTFTENVQEPAAAMVPPERLTDEADVVMVPVPQDPVRPLGLGTARPAGRVSVKATPVSATVALGLVMVKLSVVVAFNGILAAPNAFAMEGGAMTVMLAVLLVAPGPLSVEETGPVVLFSTPAATPVTLSEIEQEPFAASVPPARVTDPEPAAAVTVPPHVVVKALGVATASPAGRASVNATPVSATPLLGLLMVKLSEVELFSRTLARPNALAIVGGVATVRLAEAVFPVPPFVDVTLPVVLV